MTDSNAFTRTGRRRALVQIAGSTLALACAPLRAADAAKAGTLPADYPNRYIEFIIPFAPGGGVDLFGRTVAQLLNEQKIVSKQITVVNRPGAGGSVGMQLMVQRKGDPYILLGIAIHAIVTPLTLGTPYSYKDMTPIAKVFSEYEMMVVRAESPIKSLKDIENVLRKDPGGFSIGGASLGNADHIAVALFAKAIGVDPGKLRYIPYSGGESNPAILGGHVDVGMGGLDLITQVEAGRMRVLAISAPKRLGGRFKNMPTFTEQGYDVINENWRGIFGPPEMPAGVVQYWKNALAQMEKSAAWKAELEKNQWVNT
ncbi:MAG TPA: tripartite tricarboxylate transporter substrate-binding protein, partial [Burkholderiales bacterium]|nr:tripartite tricarboxylate transporter substrate-binding protein [Burkholderiales bacterium]